MESAQIEEGGGMDKLLDFHLYFTAALQRTDMRAVGLQLAMDLIHRKVDQKFEPDVFIVKCLACFRSKHRHLKSCRALKAFFLHVLLCFFNRINLGM